MRIALIDIGTNSARLDIWDCAPEAPASRLWREKEMVRLGDGLYPEFNLQPASVSRTLRALETFLDTCRRYQTDKVVAVATCAVREAKNGAWFTSRVERDLGLPIQVLSGEEEATLILRGILRDERTAEGSFAFVDIGGGSMEMGIWDNGRIPLLKSLPLGAARLQQTFMPNGTGSEQELSLLRDHVMAVLRRESQDQELPPIRHLLGSSGTVKALVAVFATLGQSQKLRLRDVQEFADSLAGLDLEDIRSIPGMTEKRADIIFPGVVALECAMRFLGAPIVNLTNFSLRDGLLSEVLNEERRQDKPSILRALS